MLTALQKNLLKRAAKRARTEMGSIFDIFGVALSMQDWDTCDYIAEHYATLQHFTQEQLDWLQQYRQAVALDAAAERAAATVH